MPSAAARLSRTERKQRTRDELISAAHRLFTARGFHATSLDDVAAEAGYTKGAIYSNFESKEELFFAVYERHAERSINAVAALMSERGAQDGIRQLARDSSSRRGRDNGWLAVFFEFWAHVIRNPELRTRFAQIHKRAYEPFTAATADVADEAGISLPVETDQFVIAMNAMQFGLSLERLTRPREVDADLGVRMIDLVMESAARR